MSSSSRVTLLGPQRLQRTLGGTLESLGVDGPVATITAGWQERERDDRELHEHLGSRSVNLDLYERARRVLDADPTLGVAYRERQDRLRQMQELYRLRLGHAMAATYALFHRAEDPPILVAERASAIEAVRTLDRIHLERVRGVYAEFEERWRPLERDAIRRERRAIAQAMAPCAAVAIAGGHVAILINRLRLFDLPSLLEDRPLVAWSAGAMAVSERIVLFHDFTAQGAQHAEVLEAGLGLSPDVVVLPHARRRLALDAPARIAVFARRFAPAACLALNEGARIDWDGSGYAFRAVLRLAPEGTVPEAA